MNIIEKTQKKIETSRKKLAKTIELKSYRKLAVNFLILTINLIIIILYFSLSQAKIMIVPAKEEITHSMSLPIKEEVSLNDTELAISGNITSTQVEDTKNFIVESTSTVEKNASGNITIYNTTGDRNQIFVKETRFQNDAGIEIKINQRVQIPPKGQVAVQAYASEKGKSGNISSTSGKFQVVALPYLKDKIYAQVDQEFTGGESVVKVVTPTAFNNAKDAIKQSLLEKAWNILSESNSDIKKENLVIEITDLNSDANPGDKNVDNFTLRAKARINSLVYDKNRAEEIIKQELIKRIPPDKILVDFINEPIVNASKDGLQVTVSATAMVQRKVPDAILNQEDIIGMNEEEVKEHFTQITGIRDVQIKFWPFWVRSVPNLKDHIDIEIKK
ncbi:hypothetical protein KKF64_02915 [Patescibacteria group bacterium]|nr:hypothetical protein [Patescibacteria group bacterium]